ncbi:MAG: alpha/beta hydrolase family esterase [Acidobacteriota bacterium]
MRNLAVVLVLASCNFNSGALPAAPPDAPGSGAGATDGAAVAHCTGKPLVPHDDVWTIQSGGLPRVVNVHVPASYDPANPMPLVMNFHGFTSDAIQEAVLSQMTAKADAAGFVVIYPYGTGAPLSWDAGACCGQAVQNHVDDIGFVKDVIATAEDRLCIDDARIYATGMSNGGFLSHRIGCELADRIAAIAPVAGVNGMATCNPSRPMPVIHFHGTADPLVPYTGSTSLGFISVADSFAAWGARDGCTGDPVETFRNGDSHCATYQQCAGGAEVTLCTVDNGGHTWPGGLPVPSLGYTTTDLSATDAMWEFFQAHPLR